MPKKKKKSKASTSSPGGGGGGGETSPAVRSIAAKLAKVKLSELEAAEDDFDSLGSLDSLDCLSDAGLDDEPPMSSVAPTPKKGSGPSGGRPSTSSSKKKKKKGKQNKGKPSKSPHQPPPKLLGGGGGGSAAKKSTAPSPGPAIVAEDEEAPVDDLIVLRPKRPAQNQAKASTTSSGGGNERTIHLNASDAHRIDVVDGEEALIVAVDSDGRLLLPSSKYGDATLTADELHVPTPSPPFVALCSVRVAPSTSSSVGASTPQSSRKGKRGAPPALAAGTVRILPPVLCERLFDSSSGGDSNGAIVGGADTPTVTAQMSTPSPSKSKFSFNRGGGGDLLVSPEKQPGSASGTGGGSGGTKKFSFARGGGGDSLVSPDSRTLTKTTGGNVTPRRTQEEVRLAVLPLRPEGDASSSSPTTRTIRSLLCRDATAVILRSLLSPSGQSPLTLEVIRSSGLMLERTALATCCGLSVQVGGVLAVSFRGRKERFEVLHLDAGEDHISSHETDSAGDAGEVPEVLKDLQKWQTEKGRPPILCRVGPSTRVRVMAASEELPNDARQLLRQRQNQRSNESSPADSGEGDLAAAMQGLSVDTSSGTPQGETRALSESTGAASASSSRRRKKHVAGLDSTLSHLQSLLLPPLLHPELFPRTGPIRAPRGVLLHGPGGTGKSVLARQVAEEIRAGIFGDGDAHTPRGNNGQGEDNGERDRGRRRKVVVRSVSCSSIQASTSVAGEAERKLSRIFDAAEREATGAGGVSTLLVLDDVHLICPRRGFAGGGGAGADRVASTLLALMDGIGRGSAGAGADRSGNRRGKAGGAGAQSSPGNVVVLAVTANPSLLDPALRRPGRLDSEVEVPIPDDGARAEILTFLLGLMGADNGTEAGGAGAGGLTVQRPTPEEAVDLARLAKGFTGADCALCVKEAARAAILRGLDARADADDGSHAPAPVIITLDDVRRAVRVSKPSTIRSVAVEVPRVPWSSIGGMESVKTLLREAIELPLSHPHLFESLGIPPPRGVLLYGPPGCSKTLMARALATEGRMNFLAVKGPELLSKWLGESERALAALFRRARLASPCVVFFDEVDAIASKRGGGGGSGGGERMLSQLLTELDGVGTPSSGAGAKKNPRVVVVGATNRPDLLDPAMTRPGRIDRMIYVGPPDRASREGILRIGLRGKACEGDIDIQKLAADEMSDGFSGAEIIAICREAALFAIEESEDGNEGDPSSPKIGMRHLERSVKGMSKQITPEMQQFYASYRATTT